MERKEGKYLFDKILFDKIISANHYLKKNNVKYELHVMSLV